MAGHLSDLGNGEYPFMINHFQREAEENVRGWACFIDRGKEVFIKRDKFLGQVKGEALIVDKEVESQPGSTEGIRASGAGFSIGSCLTIYREADDPAILK